MDDKGGRKKEGPLAKAHQNTFQYIRVFKSVTLFMLLRHTHTHTHTHTSELQAMEGHGSCLGYPTLLASQLAVSFLR